MLGDVRLHEKIAFVGVEAAGEVEPDQLAHIGAQLTWVIFDSDGVLIDHAENVVAAVEVPDPVADRAEIVADVQMARWLYARKNALFHVPNNSLTLAPISSSRISASPTRIASTPASCNRSTSSR